MAERRYAPVPKIQQYRRRARASYAGLAAPGHGFGLDTEAGLAGSGVPAINNRCRAARAQHFMRRDQRPDPFIVKQPADEGDRRRTLRFGQRLERAMSTPEPGISAIRAEEMPSAINAERSSLFCTRLITRRGRSAERKRADAVSLRSPYVGEVKV